MDLPISAFLSLQPTCSNYMIQAIERFGERCLDVIVRTYVAILGTKVGPPLARPFSSKKCEESK